MNAPLLRSWSSLLPVLLSLLPVLPSLLSVAPCPGASPVQQPQLVQAPQGPGVEEGGAIAAAGERHADALALAFAALAVVRSLRVGAGRTRAAARFASAA